MTEKLNVQIARYAYPLVHVQVRKSGCNSLPFDGDSLRSYGAAFDVRDAALWKALPEGEKDGTLKSLAGTHRMYTPAVMTRETPYTLTFDVVTTRTFPVSHKSKSKTVKVKKLVEVEEVVETPGNIA